MTKMVARGGQKWTVFDPGRGAERGAFLGYHFGVFLAPKGFPRGSFLGTFRGAFSVRFLDLFLKLLAPRRSDHGESGSWEKGPGGGRGRYKFFPLDCCIGYFGQFWCLSLLLCGFERRDLDA